MNPTVKRNTNVEEVLQESQQYLPTIMVERWLAMAVERGDNKYEFQYCYGVNQKGGDSSSDNGKERLPLSMETTITTAEDDEDTLIATPPQIRLRPGPLFRQRSNSFRLPRPVAEAQQREQQASLLHRCGSLRTLDFDLDTPVQEMITPLPPIKLIDYSCSKRRASTTGRPQDEEEERNDPGRYHTRDQLKLMNSSAHKSFSSSSSSEEDEELGAMAPPPPAPVRLQRQRSSSLPPMTTSRSTTKSLLMEDDSLHLLDLEEDDSDSEEGEDENPQQQQAKRGLVDYTKRRCSRIPRQPHRPLFRQKSNSFRFSKKTTMAPPTTTTTTTKLGCNNSTGNLGFGSSFDFDAWMHDKGNGDADNNKPGTTIPIQFRVRRSSMTHNNSSSSSNNITMNQSSPQLNHNNSNHKNEVNQQQWGSNSDHPPRLGRQIHRRSSYRQLIQGNHQLGTGGKGMKEDKGRGRSPITNTSISSSTRRASASPTNQNRRREQHSPSSSSSRPQRRRASMAGSLVPPPQYWVNNKLDIPPSSDQHPSSSTSSPPRRATDITAPAPATTTTNNTVNKKDSTSTTGSATTITAIKLPAVPRPRRIQWTKSNSCSHLDLMDSSDDDEEEKEHNNKKKDINKLRRRTKSRKGAANGKKRGSSSTLMTDRSWNGNSMDMSRSDKDHSLRRASMASHFITGTRIKRHSMSPARDM